MRTHCIGLHTLVVTLFLVLGGAHAAWADTLVLMWDQNPEPNITAYRVFVGTSSGAYSETFDVSGFHTTFVYSNAVRGRRYYFAVAAQVDDEVWGPQSLEVAETAAAATGGESRFAPTDAGAPVSAGAGVEVIATGLQPVTALAVSPAGVGLLVEGGRIVRAFGSSGLQQEPALEMDSDARVEGVALDPTFDRTGRAFLATSRTRRDGTRELTIERHRLLGGILGEAAAIVPGLDADEASPSLITVAADGRIFVAQAGVVLAFTSEGRIPDNQRSGSPALAEGLERPASVAWDESTQTLWLTGRDAGGALLLEQLATSSAQRQVRSLPAMATDRAAAPADVPTALVVNSGRVSVARADAEAVVEFDDTSGAATRQPTSLGSFGQPVAIAAGGPEGKNWYLVLRVASRDGTTSDTLVRLYAASPAGQSPAP